MTKRLLKGLPIDLGVTGDGCTAFAARNEKGVAIALLAVPEAEPPYDSRKITLNTTTAIRLVLDRAATVEDADTDYQIATNFIAYNGLNIGEGFTEFERYDAAEI